MMDFLSRGTWWVLLFAGAFSYFISSFGRHGRGTKSPQISAIGTLLSLLCIALTFVFSGWQGGIAMIVSLLIWVYVAEWLMHLLFRKLLPGTTSFGFHRFLQHDGSRFNRRIEPHHLPGPGEDLFDWARRRTEEEEKMMSRVLGRPEIVGVLLNYGKNPEDIKEIYQTLILSGAGYHVAESVIGDPKLLSEYLRMKADGASDLEIMSRFVEGL